MKAVAYWLSMNQDPVIGEILLCINQKIQAKTWRDSVVWRNRAVID
jgi:hypothetical protein